MIRPCRARFRWLTSLPMVAVCACSSGDAKEDISDLRAELLDVRAEIRGLREEIRELRPAKEAPPTAVEPDDGEVAAVTENPEPEASKAATDADSETPSAPSQTHVNLQVTSNPGGATVFFDQKKIGTTPLTMQVPSGSEEVSIRLEKAGYRPRLMSVRPDEDTKLSVQLARKNAPQGAVKPPPAGDK